MISYKKRIEITSRIFIDDLETSLFAIVTSIDSFNPKFLFFEIANNTIG